MPERKKKDSKGKRAAAEAEAASVAGQAEAVDSEPDVPGETAPAEAAPGESVAAEVDRAAGLEVELAALKDQLLRALAETENLRRRSQREREDALKYAAAPFMRDLIGVVDNLRRAMASVSPEALEADEHLKTLMDGLEMTETELATVFERHHIVKIDPLGERLDPHSHEAMFEVPDPETPSGTVVQVVQAGYRLHDRLLRPAQVGVAKGGPAPEPAPQPQGQPQPRAAAAAERTEPKPKPQAAPEAAGNGDETPPGSTVDTSA